MVAWVIFLVVAIPVLGVLIWFILDEAFVRVEPGKLGLVVARGKATDRVLEPGPHFVPRFRKMTVEEYPSLELSYRAGDDETDAKDRSDFEHAGPPLRVILGDRVSLELAYTLRLRLDTNSLRSVHERFGSEGIWSAVRDGSGRSLRASLADPAVSVDDLFGAARGPLEQRLSEALTEDLGADGFVLTLFSIGDLDLGRTGDVIQAIVRARFETEREEAEAATRQAEVRIDAELRPQLEDALDAALRYRELSVWRELVQSRASAKPMLPSPSHPADEATASTDATRRAVASDLGANEQ